MDLGKMRAFYIIAKEKKLVEAAKILNISQPSLSTLVSDLEYRFKTKLFNRTPKGMQLTPAGERLYDFAHKLVHQAENFEKVFFERQEGIAGDIKILTTPYMASEWLIPKLKGFLDLYPGVKPKIIANTYDLNHQEADVTIRTFVSHQPMLIQHELMTNRICLYASQEYLEKHGVPQTAKDLDDHRLVTLEGNHSSLLGSVNWILRVGRRKEECLREGAIAINSLHGLINAAIHGLGIVELPEGLAKGYPVVEVLPDIPKHSLPLYFIYSREREKSPIIRALYNYIK
jgi:DNA-binding transcriptional LysR family regulator